MKSLKELIGSKLAANDGLIGCVKDFYFEDQNWSVRYVIADTRSWVPDRNVLLSPHVFGPLKDEGEPLSVNLTMKQIQESPPIELHKPVSRQCEKKFYASYGLPSYLVGGDLWGMGGYPVLELLAKPAPKQQNSETLPKADSHLRSVQSVNGYHVVASDGNTGHISDFMLNPRNWSISQLVIKSGLWPLSNEVHIPPGKVIRISYEESTVFINMTREAFKKIHAPRQFAEK